MNEQQVLALADLVSKTAVLNVTLRDFFAAFALNAVIRLDLEDATHGSDAAYAYAAADAMLAQRGKKAED